MSDILPLDDAKEWAWKQVKKDCGLEKLNLTCGDEMAYYGFFIHGFLDSPLIH